MADVEEKSQYRRMKADDTAALMKRSIEGKAKLKGKYANCQSLFYFVVSELKLNARLCDGWQRF